MSKEEFDTKKINYYQFKNNELLSYDSKSINNLFNNDIITLTGRIRQNLNYTVSFNYYRSGLAADLSKLALWNLVYSEFKIVAFIHDEIILEINNKNIYSNTKIAEIIMNNSLPELSKIIPIKCKSKIMKNWIC
jgi:DNA polymerase I-like protein with 3'-5' exonuclease and polymerase domains